MRVRTKIYDRVAGVNRKRKLRNVFLGLLLLSIIITISVWMIVEVLNEIRMLTGFPWDGIRGGELPSLLILFVVCFSVSALYILYYRGVREISPAAPRYLLTITILVILARLLFRL